MNWINGFELLCYGITAILLADILIRKKWKEIRLFCSASLAGFVLELLAVRVTGIYHYSPVFWINLGVEPYQFPFFGGLMWGGLTVCGLRAAEKLGLNRIMTSLLTGWLIVSMDLLLDVAAIRLDGGFWVWDGREITLDITHHMFMSVIWVNFLGYLFETPAVVYLTMQAETHKAKSAGMLFLRTIGIGLGGVAVVGVASGTSLLLNSLTDEWFACIAFILAWTGIIFCGTVRLFRNQTRLSICRKTDLPGMVFWAAMYGYCIAALVSLGIFQAMPLYCVLAVVLTVGTLLLTVTENRE